MKSGIRIIAHRGVHVFERENTLPAFRLSLRFDGAELDVRATKDGKIVVSHDATLSRVFKSPARIKSRTYSELKKEVVELPLLGEALKIIKGRIAMVEIKEAGIEEEVVGIVKKSGAVKNVIITSFLENVLKKVKTLDRRIKTGLIVVVPFNAVKAAVKLNCDAICFFHKILPDFMIAKAVEAGLEVYIWTVDDEEEFKKFSKQKITGIVSNNPGGLK